MPHVASAAKEGSASTASALSFVRSVGFGAISLLQLECVEVVRLWDGGKGAGLRLGQPLRVEETSLCRIRSRGIAQEIRKSCSGNCVIRAKREPLVHDPGETRTMRRG